MFMRKKHHTPLPQMFCSADQASCDECEKTLHHPVAIHYHSGVTDRLFCTEQCCLAWIGATRVRIVITEDQG